MTKLNKNKIAVVGLGYVGMPLALLASKKGYEVFGIDTDKERVQNVNDRLSPFVDKKVQRELKKTKLIATTNFDIVSNCNIVIICVPTPIDKDKTPNLGLVETACVKVSEFIKKGTTVILESTVNPGVCESIVIPILEEGSGLISGKNFHVVHCPERINPGDKKWNVENINRVIGSLDKKGLKTAKDFYSSIISGKIYLMNNLKEAEAVKIVENSFRDINIAFVNELAMSFSKLGIDVVNVIKGAETKPFSFLAHYPGCGVGGHCIPVDPYYLIAHAKENGFNHEFLSLARNINNNMPKFTVDVLTENLNKIGLNSTGTKISILGISYKANINDDRESPSFDIVDEARKQGYIVSVFDPYVLDKSTSNTLDDTVKESIAVIIATNHKQFTKLTPEFFIKNNIHTIIDGRNCLNKDKFINAGINYKGIGR